ncbi:unnamed protein product [Pedinophyceae sp. YPF-701]|nr:unnamed protein product [Pedinophyceae sp. YPF-701]
MRRPGAVCCWAALLLALLAAPRVCADRRADGAGYIGEHAGQLLAARGGESAEQNRVFGHATQKEAGPGVQRPILDEPGYEADGVEVKEELSGNVGDGRPEGGRARELWTALLVFLAGAFANAAGVGGGAIYVPIFALALDLDVKSATAVSQALIVGGSFASVLLNSTKQHPYNPARALVDLEVCTMLEPGLMLGITFGVLINVAMPEWLVNFLLASVLVYLSLKTVSKGKDMLEKETNLFERNHNLSRLGNATAPVSRVNSMARSLKRWGYSRLRPSKAVQVPRNVARSMVDPNSLRRHLLETDVSADDLAGTSPLGTSPGSVITGASPPAPCVWPGGVVGDYGSGDEEAPPASNHSMAANDGPRRAPGGSEIDGAAALEPRFTLMSQSGGLERAAAHAQAQGQGQARSGVEDEDDEASSQARQQLSDMAAMYLVSRGGGGDVYGWDRAMTLNRMMMAGGRRVRHALGQVEEVEEGEETETPNGERSLHASEAPAPRWTLSPLWKEAAARFALLAAMWLSFVTIQLYRDGQAPCAPVWWSTIALQSVLSVAAALLMLLLLRRAKQHPGDPESRTALQRQPLTKAAQLTATAASAGVVAGIVGMSGGMIMAPVLLDAGLPPQVAAASSALVVLLSSSAASIQFFASGHMPLGYSVVYGAICFVASVVGIMLIRVAVKATGRASVIVLVLGGIMAACVLVIVATSYADIYDGIAGLDFGLGDFCEAQAVSR